MSVALLLLLTGVSVPADRLPAGVRALGSVLPITHAAEAARRLVAGDGLAAALWSIAAEVTVNLGYAVLAAVLLKVFEAESRRHASLDTL